MIRSIQPPVLWTLAGILVALITATLLSQWLKRANPNKDYSELVQRVNSWWWMAGIFALAVALNVNVAIVACCSGAISRFRSITTGSTTAGTSCS